MCHIPSKPNAYNIYFTLNAYHKQKCRKIDHYKSLSNVLFGLMRGYRTSILMINHLYRTMPDIWKRLPTFLGGLVPKHFKYLNSQLVGKCILHLYWVAIWESNRNFNGKFTRKIRVPEFLNPTQFLSISTYANCGSDPFKICMKFIYKEINNCMILVWIHFNLLRNKKREDSKQKQKEIIFFGIFLNFEIGRE